VNNSKAEKNHGMDECFRYSLLASLKKPEDHQDRCKQYDGPDYEGLLDFTDIPYPTPCAASVFKKFEKNNPHVALNVFSFPTNGKSLSSLRPTYISNCEGRKELNIMMLYDIGDKSICILHDPVNGFFMIPLT
jgi:hypothetical protein